MFLILWEFEVKRGDESRFEKVYGPQGPWVQLFQSDTHFRQTQLLKDPSRSRIYFTLDSGIPKTITNSSNKATRRHTIRWIKLQRS
jgi:hypothetical protein